jgi:hypothetical protein
VILGGGGATCQRWFVGGLLAFAIVLLAGFPLTSAEESLLTSEDCLACHSDRELSKLEPEGQPISLYVDRDALHGSIHGSLECVQCHADATALPHPEALARVRCQTCHGDAVRKYEESVHGRAQTRGEQDAAGCQNCHGSAHDLQKVRDPGSPVYPLNLPGTCGACHGDPELARRHGIPVENAYQLYTDSIHGRALTKSGLLGAANCSSCHGIHDIQAAGDPRARVNRRQVAETCGTCHVGTLREYAQSIHGVLAGQGQPQAPTCADCHTAHAIKRASTGAFAAEVIGECGTCHQASYATYRGTYHGKAVALKHPMVATCSSCHTAHRILPVSDDRSSVAAENRLETCRGCHHGATASFANYIVHANYGNR